MGRLRFFIDFDGTVTQTDVVDLVLERFARGQWEAAERDWTEGRIGSRECLTTQLSKVRATEEAVGRLLDEVRVDPGFVPFLKRARSLSVPVTIVSDGFDLFIQPLLRRFLAETPELLEGLAVFSNRLTAGTDGYRVHFPEGPVCEHHCANCKERVIQKHRREGEKIVFAGDGLSDRFGAAVSDLTFAKGKLLDFCKGADLAYRPFAGFGEIDRWLAGLRKEEYANV